MTDKLRVQHILDAIAETEKYLSGVSFEDFLANLALRNLQFRSPILSPPAIQLSYSHFP